ncbi:MAG: FAD-dependent oxidoreductase, partial [Melioribacteraceae bacterium]
MSARKNIIVIGGNAAGPAAAAKAKRTAPAANVLMVEAGEFISTGTCEIPYVLSGEIKNYQDIVFFDPESFEKEKGVKVLSSHLAERIDRSKKIITLRNLKSGHNFEQEYDKLILCTGSKVVSIPSLSPSLENIFTLKSVADLIRVKTYLENNRVREILIVGAGYIGLETADALKKIGFSVTIIDKEKLPMRGAENETRGLAADLIRQNGIEYLCAAHDIKFNNDSKKFLSVKIEGRVYEYDLVLVSAGIEPNNALAVSSKLRIGRSGGIKVDQKMRTEDPNIFAAGDCIEIINRITGKADYFPVATIAQQTGHTAGENSAGGNKSFQPVVKNVAVKFLGKSLVTVGLNSIEAVENGFSVSSVSAVIPNLVKVMPG